MQNAILILAAATVVICSPVLALVAQGRPTAGDVALVIAPPWGQSAGDIVTGAGLQDVTPERAPIGALVLLETPDSIDRLYREGAWLITDGKKVLELCKS